MTEPRKEPHRQPVVLKSAGGRDARRFHVSELYLRGFSYRRIALDLGVSLATVAKDMRKIRDLWRKQAATTYHQRLAEQLAKIDLVEAEAWKAWERSKEDSLVVTKAVRGDDGDHMTVKTASQAGDDRFLGRVAWCVTERCRLMGLHDPEAAPDQVTSTEQDESTTRTYFAIVERIRAAQILDRNSGAGVHLADRCATGVRSL